MAACSPSLDLLLRRAERNAGPDDARAPPDGCRDELAPEAEAPDPHREDEHPQAPGAWDAWDGARRGAAGAEDLRREPADEGAEKLAGRAQDVRARDAWSLLAFRLAQWALPGAAAALCIPDAAQSAEQSFAEPVVAADLPLQVAQADAARVPEAGAQSMP